MILLAPALLVSLMTLYVGLTFGFNLWRADRPFAIALWFAVIMLPALVLAALKAKEEPRLFYPLAAISWLFVAFWIFHGFIWMPWAAGGPPGW